MDMNGFARRVDLARRFEAALQEVEHGRGWAVFEGLQGGECVVRVLWDGASIRFEKMKEPIYDDLNIRMDYASRGYVFEPDDPELPEIGEEAIVADESPTKTEEKPKKSKRKKKEPDRESVRSITDEFKRKQE